MALPANAKRTEGICEVCNTISMTADQRLVCECNRKKGDVVVIRMTQGKE